LGEAGSLHWTCLSFLCCSLSLSLLLAETRDMVAGVIGSGSWATALSKLLTDNGHVIHWYVRNPDVAEHILKYHHNPNYLSSVYFDEKKIHVHSDLHAVLNNADVLIVATPSAYVPDVLRNVTAAELSGKKIVSAIKGLLPEGNLFLNDHLRSVYGFDVSDYFTIMGPCHAEEVAAEKLSYLTFSGLDATMTDRIASLFANRYLYTVVNQDIYGVQYAAVLKNIYALGAGMAHGLEYGDNFLSVFIANCADEMASFLRAVGVQHVEVGVHEITQERGQKKSPNYAASVYLGDLLVTCYSLYSRNRTFGNMIGKGYSVQATQLALNMVAEGFNGCRSIYQVNQKISCPMPIAETLYRILWEKFQPSRGFRFIEETLV